MRTDSLNRRAFALAAALLALWTVAPAAQDTTRTTAAAPTIIISSDRIGVGDVRVGANEQVDGDVVAPFGDVRIDGRVSGDVFVGKGNLLLGPAASIDGDAVVNGGTLTNHGTIAGDAVVRGGRLINDGGRVLGDVVAPGDRSHGRGTRAARERSHAAGALRMRHGWASPVREGLQGIFSTIALALVLGGIGAALIFYAYPRLERVSDEIRKDPVRAGIVGFVASILVMPVALAAVVGLAVTIIGIPLIALVPVAVAALLFMGLLGAAHALGERTAERNGSFQLRHRNGYSYLGFGIAALLAPMLLAHLLEVTGFLRLLGDLVEFFAWLLLYVVTVIGMGAVVLTRAGGWLDRRPRRDPLDEADAHFDSAFAEPRS